MTWLILRRSCEHVLRAAVVYADHDVRRIPADSPSRRLVYSAAARVRRRTVMRRPVFWAIWLAFYLNITCGLALISQEKDILHDALAVMPRFAGLDTAAFAAATAGVISTVLAVDAVFNAVGRLGFSTLSDHCRRRETSYVVIFVMSIAVCLLQVVFHSIDNGTLWMILMMLFLVNAGTAAISPLPVLLGSISACLRVSTVHGLALSAWALPNCRQSAGVLRGPLRRHPITATLADSVLAVLYAVALVAILWSCVIAIRGCPRCRERCGVNE